MPNVKINLDGTPTTVAYEDAGSGVGEPLILVHGFPLDGRIFDDVAPLIAKSHRVIVIDLPGFGRSSAIGSFTMRSQARAIVALLDALKIDRAWMGGLSMGGYVLQALVRDALQRVRGLSFIDTRAKADDATARAGRDKLIESIKQGGTPAVVEAMWPKMLHPRTYEDAPVVAARLKQIIFDQSPATLEAACVALRDREDFWDQLGKLPCPLQVIVGDGDVIAPVEISKAIHEGAPGSRLDIIPGAGHVCSLERPAELAAALSAFMAG